MIWLNGERKQNVVLGTLLKKEVSERGCCRMGILIENVSALTDFKCMGAPPWVIFREAKKAIGSLAGIQWVTPGHCFQAAFSLTQASQRSPFTLVTISKPTSATVYLRYSCLSAPKDLRQHVKTWLPMSCHSLQLGSHQCLTGLLSVSPWQASKRAVLNYFSLLSPRSYLLRVQTVKCVRTWVWS